jgi:hypothetical protein
LLTGKITGNFSNLGPDRSSVIVIPPKILADLEGNSLLKGTGNFFEGTANLNARAGNLNAKTGSRRRRPVNKPTYSQGQDWGDTEGLSDQGDSSEPPARLLGDDP